MKIQVKIYKWIPWVFISSLETQYLFVSLIAEKVFIQPNTDQLHVLSFAP